MRKIIIISFSIIVAALILSGCNGDSEDTIAVVDDVTITLAVDPDPPAAGDSVLLVKVMDADGSAISDAHVAVYGNMDHEGMEPQEGSAESSVDDVYHVPFHWSMGGGWIVDVTVTLPDGRGVAKDTFELFVEAVSKDSVINQDNTDEQEGHDD